MFEAYLFSSFQSINFINMIDADSMSMKEDITIRPDFHLLESYHILIWARYVTDYDIHVIHKCNSTYVSFLIAIFIEIYV